MTKQTVTDCLVIGGGVIGLTTARALSLSGLSVTLLDKGLCGQESSWAGAGIISPLYPWRYSQQVNQLSSNSQAIYQDLCATLHQSTGIDSQYHQTGLLMADEYQSNLAQTWLSKHNIRYQTTDKGLLFPNIAQLRNPRFIQALKADIIRLGGKVLENHRVDSLITRSNITQGVKANHENFYAGQTIIATGVWANDLLPGFASNDATQAVDIYPVKGQILLLRAKQTLINPIVPHIFLANDKYLVPRTDGLILVGASYEHTGFDQSLSQVIKDELYDFAIQSYPLLSQANIVNHWSGLRPANRLGDIYIGKHPHYDNLYLNVGHFSNGINTAPASAKTITKMITQ